MYMNAAGTSADKPSTVDEFHRKSDADMVREFVEARFAKNAKKQCSVCGVCQELEWVLADKCR